MHPYEFEFIIEAALRSLGVSGRVLVGVSGGADSVALLCALARVRDAAVDDLPLTVLAGHLDHQLRGQESTADAAWVRRLCWKLKTPLSEDRANLGKTALDHSALEETARQARYGFLAQTALAQDCQWVLVAHTADDQAETVLHRVLRGTGIDGLRGMPPIRPLTDGVQLARPLLDISRADVVAFLQWAQQDWREDQSNRDTSLTRNSIRHDLLPMLRERYNPQIVPALLRLAQQASELQAVIEPLVERLLAECRLDTATDVVRLDSSPLADQPLHLVREVLKRAWRCQNWPLAGMGFDHWTTLAAVSRNELRAIDLPGAVHAERRGTLLILTRRS